MIWVGWVAFLMVDLLLAALLSFRYPKFMSILIAEDNAAQRQYLAEVLAREFPAHMPVIETENGEQAIAAAIAHRPALCVLDIQMPEISGVKAARAIWREFPETRIIFWTQFPHEIYIDEIRKIIRNLKPQPAYGFVQKNNPESRLVRFIGTVLEDGADMIDPAYKDAFQRPLLTEFESEALRYLALGLSNWGIARKCSVSMRGVEGRLANLYEKLFATDSPGASPDAYEKQVFNVRTRSYFEALTRGLIVIEELERDNKELRTWLDSDYKKYTEETEKL